LILSKAILILALPLELPWNSIDLHSNVNGERVSRRRWVLIDTHSDIDGGRMTHSNINGGRMTLR
jgi:hypothetical protein